MEEALRAVQITLLFAAAMLWLGVQAAQTAPAPTAAENSAIPVVVAGKAG